MVGNKTKIFILIFLFTKTLGFSQNRADTVVLKSEKIAENSYNKKQYKTALLFYRTLTEFYLTDFKPNKISGTAYFYSQFNNDSVYYYASIYKTLFSLLKKHNGAVPLNTNNARKLRNNQNKNLYNVLEKTKECDYFKKVVLNDIFDFLNKLPHYNIQVNQLLKNKMNASEPIFYEVGNPDAIKKQINYEKVKSRVENAKNIKSIDKLAIYLTKGMNEVEKVYSIYHWVEKNIKYVQDSTTKADVNTFYKKVAYRDGITRHTQTALNVFNKKEAVCEGYTNLFLALCKSAGIDAQYVSGYSPSNSSFYGGHAWNTIKINKQYYLVDVTWGGEGYFLSNPIFFNSKHFAEGSRQLLFCPYTKFEFFNKIEKYAKKKLEKYPDSLRLIIKLSNIYYTQNKYNKVIQLLEKTKGITNDFNYWMNLAVCYEDISSKKTIKIYRKLLSLKPNHIKANNRLANMYISAYKIDSSLFYYNQVLKTDKNNQTAIRGKAYCYNFLKKYDKAKLIANKLYKIEPDNYKNLNLLASVAYNNLDYRKTIEYSNKSLQIKPDNIKALKDLCLAWRKVGDINKALFFNSKALIIYPNDSWLKKERATIYSTQKKFEKAYKILKEFVTENTDDIYILDNMAWYAFLTCRYEETFYYAHKAISINKNTAAYNSLALAYILTNQYAKAKEIYLAIKDKPYLYEPQYDTYADFFLNWINFAENNGIYHKDFKKAKLLLKK